MSKDYRSASGVHRPARVHPAGAKPIPRRGSTLPEASRCNDMLQCSSLLHSWAGVGSILKCDHLWSAQAIARRPFYEISIPGATSWNQHLSTQEISSKLTLDLVIGVCT